MERMLKWIVALRNILLRLPPRACRRGRAAVTHQFAEWGQGDFGTLVRWWLQDRATARRPRYAASADARTSKLKRVLALFRAGRLLRAVRLRCNEGLGNLDDERILSQLRGKHRRRKETLTPPETSGEAHSCIEVELRNTMRDLDDEASAVSVGSGTHT